MTPQDQQQQQGLNPQEWQDYKNKVDGLFRDFNAFTRSFYQNNFPSSQDFNKYVRFNSRMKIPHYSSLPTTCEVGELAETSGTAYICSVADTWTKIGTQS